MTQEVLKLALEALENSQNFVDASANAKLKTGWGEQLDKADKAITAIKEALAQHDSVQAKPEPEQEPVAWRVRWPKMGGGYAWVMNDAPLMAEHGFVNEPLYTTPPQGIYYTPPKRTWVGLTFAEICECESEYANVFARNIEAKLKELNT